MRYLLDTHVFLWLNTEPERIGPRLEELSQERVDLVVSAASSWEIAIKYGLGRLALPEPPASYVPERIHRIKAHALAIEHAHVYGIADLPPIHRDPFDRLLLAQARAIRVPLLTADRVLSYPIETVLVGAGD